MGKLEQPMVEGKKLNLHRKANGTTYVYKDYEEFCTIKETPKRGRRVIRNAEAITAARRQYVGYFAILTTKFKDPLDCLRVYREKDVIEKTFDDLKNELDMKRLRVHSSKNMKGTARHSVHCNDSIGPAKKGHAED
jgi:transposase